MKYGRPAVVSAGSALSVAGFHYPAPPGKHAVSLRSDDPAAREIRRAGHFILNFLPQGYEQSIRICEKGQGHLSGLTLSPSRVLSSPSIAQAARTLECALVSELESGDHVVFLGRIVNQ